MIPISDTLKNAFLNTSLHEIKGYANNAVQIIDNGNILNGGFTIERDSVSGSSIELGTAICASLTMNISNYNHRFEDKLPKIVKDIFKPGLELNFRLYPHGSTEYISLGYFVVDSIEYKKNYIVITALDRMVKFDKEIGAQISTISNVTGYIWAACSACGMTCANTQTELNAFANASVPIPSYIPDSKDVITYRTLIIWACQIMGVNAYIDWNGELRLQEYPAIADGVTEITKDNRVSSDIGATSISVTGIEYVDSDDNTYISGSSGYILSLSDNAIMNGFSDENKQTVVDNLATHITSDLSSMEYIPFSASILSMPWLMPMDRVKLTDYNGTVKDSFITDTVYKLNSLLDVEAKGDSDETHSYSSTGSFTASQQTIINRAYVDSETTSTTSDGWAYTVKKYSDGTKRAVIKKTTGGMATSSLGIYSLDTPISVDISELGFTEITAVFMDFHGATSGEFVYPNGWLIHGTPTTEEIPGINIIALSALSSILYGEITIAIEGN